MQSKKGKEILLLIQYLYFAIRSKDNCATECALCCYGIVQNRHIPLLRDRDYSLAAQLKKMLYLNFIFILVPSLEMTSNLHMTVKFLVLWAKVREWLLNCDSFLSTAKLLLCSTHVCYSHHSSHWPIAWDSVTEKWNMTEYFIMFILQ